MPTVQEIFAELPNRVDTSKLAGIDMSILFDLSGDGGGRWTLVVADSAISVDDGAGDDPTATLKMAASDWQAMATPQLSAPNIAPNNTQEVIVGPFAWTPSQLGHECMLMVASATGDPSNIDNFSGGDSIPEWRLVPHDNNIGQRNV